MAEIKNRLNGQDVEDAIRQCKTDRDPRELLFVYGRCLVHFAVDPDLIYVTTHLVGQKTRFLPINRGKFGGAGNAGVPPTRKGYATAYLRRLGRAKTVSEANPGHSSSCGEGRRREGMTFAGFRRFWAVAPNKNSSLAPFGP